MLLKFLPKTAGIHNGGVSPMQRWWRPGQEPSPATGVYIWNMVNVPG
jgi:hypothetical protein